MSIVVVGGAVLDVQAQAQDAELLRGSSVIGKVAQVAGGVGRNIAEAAHHLLADAAQQHQLPPHQASKVHLISIIGCDAAADALLASFKHLGMDTSGIMQSSSCSTPCVVTLLDRAGEVAASVADVAAAAQITPAVVQQHAPVIQQAQLLILDANFDAATLAAAAQIAAAAGVPVLYEPVSVPKSVRCTSTLQHLTYITPNANELLAIAAAVQQQAGLPPLQHAANLQEGHHSPQQLLAQLSKAAAVVLQQGVKHIILTMGSQGAALLSLQSQHQLQQQQQQHRPTTLQAPSKQHPQQVAEQDILNHQQGIDPHKQQRQHIGTLPQLQHMYTQPNSKQQPSRQLLIAHHIPAAPAKVVNLSGAGDTLVGAFAAALIRGANRLEALAIGIAAAKASVECKYNVPGPAEGLKYDRVWKDAQGLLQQLQTWHFPVSAAL